MWILTMSVTLKSYSWIWIKNEELQPVKIELRDPTLILKNAEKDLDWISFEIYSNIDYT